MGAPEKKHSECNHVRAVRKVRLMLSAWKKYQQRCTKEKYSANSQQALKYFYRSIQKNVLHSTFNFSKDKKTLNASEQYPDDASVEIINLEADLETGRSLTSEHINLATNPFDSSGKNSDLINVSNDALTNPSNDDSVTIQVESSTSLTHNAADISVTSSSNRNWTIKRMKASNSPAISNVTNLEDYDSITTLRNNESSFQVQLMTDEQSLRPSTSGDVCTLPKMMSLKSKRAKRIKTSAKKTVMRNLTFGASQTKRRCKSTKGRVNNYERALVNNTQCSTSNGKNTGKSKHSCPNSVSLHSNNFRSVLHEECSMPEVNLAEERKSHNNVLTVGTTKIPVEMRISYAQRDSKGGDTFKACKGNQRCDNTNGRMNNQCSISSDKDIRMKFDSLPNSAKLCCNLFPPYSSHSRSVVQEECFMQKDSGNENARTSCISISQSALSVFVISNNVGSNATSIRHDPDYIESNLEVMIPDSTGLQNDTVIREDSHFARIVDNQVSRCTNTATEMTNNGNTQEDQKDAVCKDFGTLPRSMPIHETSYVSSNNKRIPGNSEELKLFSEIREENVSQLNSEIATHHSTKLPSRSENVIKIEKPKSSKRFVDSQKKIGRIVEKKMEKNRRKQIRRNVLPLKVGVKPKSHVGSKHSSRTRKSTKPKEDKKKSRSKKKTDDKRQKLKLPNVGLSKLSISRKRPSAKKSGVSKLIKTSKYSIPKSIEILNSSKPDIYEGYRTLSVRSENRKEKSTSEESTLAEKSTNNFYPNKLEHFRTLKTRVAEVTLEEHPSHTIQKNSEPIEIIHTRTSNESHNSPVASSTMKLPECSSRRQHLNKDAKNNHTPNTEKMIKPSNYSIPINVEIISSTSNLGKRKLVQTVIPKYYKTLRKGTKASRAPEIQASVSPPVIPTKGKVNKKTLGRYQELEISVKKYPRVERTSSCQSRNNSSQVNITYNQRNDSLIENISNDELNKLKQPRKSYRMSNNSHAANSSLKDENDANENPKFGGFLKSFSQPNVGRTYPDKHDGIVHCAGSKAQSPLKASKLDCEFEVMNHSKTRRKNENSCHAVEANGEEMKNTSEVASEIGHAEVNAMCANTEANTAQSTDNSNHNIQRGITTGGEYVRKDVIIPSSPSLFSDNESRDTFLAITLDDNDQSIEQKTIKNVLENIYCWSDDSFGM